MGETLYRIITIRAYLNKITVTHLFIRLQLHVHTPAIGIPVCVVGVVGGGGGGLYPANQQLRPVKKKKNID